MWDKAAVNGTIQRLATLMTEEPIGLLGVCACNEVDGGDIILQLQASNQ